MRVQPRIQFFTDIVGFMSDFVAGLCLLLPMVASSMPWIDAFGYQT